MENNGNMAELGDVDEQSPLGYTRDALRSEKKEQVATSSPAMSIVRY